MQTLNQSFFTNLQAKIYYSKTENALLQQFIQDGLFKWQALGNLQITANTFSLSLGSVIDFLRSNRFAIDFNQIRLFVHEAGIARNTKKDE